MLVMGKITASSVDFPRVGRYDGGKGLGLTELIGRPVMMQKAVISGPDNSLLFMLVALKLRGSCPMLEKCYNRLIVGFKGVQSVKKLCFGTFAQVLRLCKREGVTDYELVGSMTRTVDPECQYGNPDNKVAVSRLMNCTGNLSDGRKKPGSGAYKETGESISRVRLLAPKASRREVEAQFADNVVTLIDEDKKKKMVAALLDIIQSDVELDAGKKLSFEKYMGSTKKALLSQSVFVLANLLAGLFLYTVIAVENTAGKACVKEIDETYINGLASESWLIDIVDKEQEKTSETRDASKIVVAFGAYLRNAKQKYSTVKTLLYHEQPKPFYDFYVCNDIMRRVPVPGRFSAGYTVSTISDVTVKSLTDCSRFVILGGTGGVGKSMMMRHLLLNAIENYDALKKVPIFVPLKDYDGSAENLLEYVYGKFEALGIGIPMEILESALHAGACLLLFDGLDEIATNYGKQFEMQLEVFTDRYPDNYFVISSRPYQTFVSYSRFTLLTLRPFTLAQALQLVDHLEFRMDEPAIKEKFRAQLQQSLYLTHREFTENPLLLTIMLMTFEQFAEVPSKMHIFYREAFLALSQKHDASKGAYKRILKTGLSADKFADYFAEFCSRSYYDEKFELSEVEFEKYYNVLKEREKCGDSTTTAADFLYDLCSNMCLMYFESGKYHFTHRSFQEYFCALYFSRQKDKNLKRIGDFFEKRRMRMHGDKTFNMLYDMIPDKVEEYILIPYLIDLFDTCDCADGYWTFLETIYPSIQYERGEVDDWVDNSPSAYLYEFVKALKCHESHELKDYPHYDDLVITEYGYADDEAGYRLVNLEELDSGYTRDYGTPDPVGWVYEFEVKGIRESPDDYRELLARLEDDNCTLKQEYFIMRDFLIDLRKKQAPTGESLFDLF